MFHRTVAAALGVAGCTTTETHDLAPFAVPCHGSAQQLCPVMDGDLLYDPIEGFTFTWGVAVTARIRTRTNLNPRADGSTEAHTLVAIVDATPAPVGTTFTWTFDAAQVRPGYDEPWIDVDAGTLLDGTPFRCVPEACDAVQAAYEDGTTLTATFTFAEDGLELQAAAATSAR